MAMTEGVGLMGGISVCPAFVNVAMVNNGYTIVTKDGHFIAGNLEEMLEIVRNAFSSNQQEAK